MKSGSFLFCFLLVFLCQLSGPAKAQNSELKWALGFHGTIIEPKTSIADDFFSFEINRITFGQKLSLSRYLNPSFDLGLCFSHGRMEQMFGNYRMDDRFYAGVFKLRFKLYNGYIFNEDAIIGPYVTGGVGSLKAEVNAVGLSEGSVRDNITQLDLLLGAGIRIRISDYVSLDWQTALHLPSDNTWDANKSGDKDQFLEHSIGLILNLGEGRDSDGDGVGDKRDKCANTPTGVKVDEDGCPLDTDKDGVADYQDDCPLLAGKPALKGCPDKDGDGVADITDRCPDVAGLVDLDGCPDSDADGIADTDDKCANTKAGYKVDETGCPFDKDDDGIVDEEDDCPAEKGSAVLKGCPDRDNDGVADKDDRCPDLAGIPENNGCPELPKEVISQLTKIASKIFFESGSDKLRPSSIAQLDDLSDILSKYPESNLIIEGHTDNTGDAERNVILSQKRCESVKTYLISKGIDANRLSATGFGQSHPIDDNNTASGRSKNRRVELRTQY